MIFQTVAVPTTPKSVYELLGNQQSRCVGIAMQTPSTNAANVNFGTVSAQPGYIPGGNSSDVLPIRNTKDLFIKGTSGDSVILMVFVD